MNFLSHYYFERYSSYAEHTLGALLPDLLKHVDKRYHFQPRRFEELLFAHPKTKQISEGWYGHVQVDKFFHSSDFFVTHTHQLRVELDPIITHLPVRASFLAHISLELLLDHLLITSATVNPVRLYEHLENVQLETIDRYLRTIGEVDVAQFYLFYERFVNSRYILEYVELQNVSYALFNICKRVWQFDFTSADCDAVTRCLASYKEQHLSDFMGIFQEIQDKLG